VLPALRRATAAWARSAPELFEESGRAASSSAGRITATAAILLLLSIALFAWRARRTRGAAETETWGCGFSRPTARMQYTGSSFAQMLTLRFRWAFSAHARFEQPSGPFPQRSSFGSHVPDTVLEALLLPSLRATANGAERVRRVQQGRASRVQGQALLVVVTLGGLLAWRFLYW
jgi:hypothetical protein